MSFFRTPTAPANFLCFQTDCTVFSQLATTLYVPTESYAKDILKEEYPTLVAYAERIRDTVFGKDFAKE